MALDKNSILNTFRLNSFPGHENTDQFIRPTFVVFRNTDPVTLDYVQDNFENCCDTIVLADNDQTARLKGRTKMHKKYQERVVKYGETANYIATGFYSQGVQRGTHKGKEAFVQHRSFMVWRSLDMVINNADDYNEYGSFSDNIHGWAPNSAGCITILGEMKDNGGVQGEDWYTAHNWGYTTHNDSRYFDVVVLNHSDVDSKIFKLRFGSYGNIVKYLQGILNIKQDGDFGPVTFNALRKFQKANGLDDDGIVGKTTSTVLGSDFWDHA